MNKIVITLAMMMFLNYSAVESFANDTAVIDTYKVINSYPQAKESAAIIKKQERELHKFIIEASKDIKNAKNDVDKKQKEEKYNKALAKKRAELKSKMQEWNKLQKQIYAVIENVSKKKKIKTVVRKESTLYGAEDITEDVIKKLTSQKNKKN